MSAQFYKRLSELLKIYLLLLGVFMIFRVVFLCSYTDLSEIFQNYKGDLIKAFWVGFRCDTIVLCFSLTPLLLLNLSGFLCFKQSLQAGFNRFMHFFSKFYYIILFVLILMINLTGYFYYSNFQTLFDHRVFGIIEDGTKEVLASVWSDYPIVILLLFSIFALSGWIKVVNKIQNKGKIWFSFNNIYAHIAVAVLSIALWFLGARSSLTTFPFQKNDLVFSVNLRLNDAASNSVFALKEAISERTKYSLNLNASSILAAHGFDSIEEAKRAWRSDAITNNCSFFEFKRTPHNAFLESNPPNIVVVLMEGWSSDLFNYHSKTLNLLGALEDEIPSLIFYPFCFPVHNGTIAALETFITNNVGAALSISNYSNIQLKSSTALAFQRAGYETSYFTAGYNGWRNVGNYCRTQGFDNVCGAEYMKKTLPKTEVADWGVFDQYMFDAVYKKLKENNTQPQFLICMTITNHSPHKIPKSYNPYPLNLPDSLQVRATKELQQTLSSLQTFQYANDCLGRFLNDLRNSPLGENTIVAITGDHAMTGGFSYKESELLYRWAVPLAFYIPEKYAQQLTIDTTRLVSHKDILTTIYNLGLSNFDYYATGDNIFDETTADEAFLITQSSWVIGKMGCINLASHYVFKWGNDNFYLQPTERTPELEAMRKKANAWLCGMKWRIIKN